MNKIEKIRDLDEEIFEILQEYFPKTQDSNFAKNYPETNILINMLDTSATFIKNSIYDCSETDDFYGIKILYRSLIEHYIRYKYIFTKFGSIKSDQFAKEYFEYNDAKETIEIIRAKVSEQQLYNPNFQIKDWDKLLEDHPQFRNKTRKEVENETRKYSIKNIIRFLNNEFRKGNEEMSEYLGKLLIEYSKLSSYVHGGINSYKEMMNSDDKKRDDEYNRICGLSFQLSGSIKLFNLLMYVQTDKEKFTKHYLDLDVVLKKINTI